MVDFRLPHLMTPECGSRNWVKDDEWKDLQDPLEISSDSCCKQASVAGNIRNKSTR